MSIVGYGESVIENSFVTCCKVKLMQKKLVRYMSIRQKLQICMVIIKAEVGSWEVGSAFKPAFLAVSNVI